MLNNKNILITGGTGSFGNLFVEIILKKFKPKKLIIFLISYLFIAKETHTRHTDFVIGTFYLCLFSARHVFY